MRPQEYWDSNADAWDKLDPGKSYLSEFYRNWKHHLDPPFIDIGCGHGKFLLKLAEDGQVDLFGCDISQRFVDMSKEKLRLLVKDVDKRIVQADMLQLSNFFDRAFFNTAIFSGVLQQVPYDDSRKALEEMAAITAPAAMVYFSTQSISTPPDGVLRSDKRTYDLPDGISRTYFTRYDIFDLINGLFSVVELLEKPQTEKLSGKDIMNWEGILIRQ